MEKPNIYTYADYRVFLGDYYQYAKQARRGFSFRAFSKRAGITSSNYLRLVIDGKRNLTAEMAPNFAKGCALSGPAAEFFCELVAYCQAKTTEQKNRHYQNLTRFRQFRAVRQLEGAQAEYHSTWYLPAIRELAARRDFQGEPGWIAARLDPKISAEQAKQALDTLQKLGLLVVDASGKWQQADPLVSTGPGPLGHHIFNFHHVMLERAGFALDHTPREEREISSVTVCVSQQRLLEIKRRVEAFRRELLHFAELDDEPERVVQLNFQLFPLSASETPSGE